MSARIRFNAARRCKLFVAVPLISLGMIFTLGFLGEATASASPTTEISLQTTVKAEVPISNDAAAATSDPCSGKSATYIVKNFYRGVAVYPLRCGTSTWGYNHIVIGHAYDPAAITVTVSLGEAVIGVQAFLYTANVCPTSQYYVVYNTGALNGNGVQPQGIITAYPITSEDAATAAC